MTDSESIRVLLIEDDPAYARLLRVMLNRAGLKYDMAHVTRLLDGRNRLKQDPFDVILLDLMLPDTQGLETFRQAQAAAPEVPIIVITGIDNETFAVKAVQAGAQDYLVKGQADMQWLPRSIRYAIERQRAQAELNHQATRLRLLRDVDDELTYRLNVQYVLTMALDAAVRLSLASAGLIGLIEDGQIQRLQNINYDPKALADAALLETGIIARCLRQQQAECITDDDPDYRPLHPKMRAQIAIPLMSQDRVLGFLSLETLDPLRFGPDTFAFVKLLAARVAAALDNARLYQTTQDQLNELQQLYTQVSALEQTKTNLIRMAAHDLRNPLNNALGYTHLLNKAGDALSAELRGYVATIQDALQRMKSITDDILSLERAEALRGVNAQVISLADLIENAFGEFEPQAARKRQRFTLNLPATPVLVHAEPTILYRAAINLIQNAIKYTPDAGCVAVRLDHVGREAVFEVSDNGYGIPEDQQAQLFQPFFRARSPETASIEGSGLGLYLVKSIVEQHGGQMIFHSAYGQGSTFGFRLPLAES